MVKVIIQSGNISYHYVLFAYNYSNYSQQLQFFIMGTEGLHQIIVIGITLYSSYLCTCSCIVCMYVCMQYVCLYVCMNQYVCVCVCVVIVGILPATAIGVSANFKTSDTSFMCIVLAKRRKKKKSSIFIVMATVFHLA